METRGARTGTAPTRSPGTWPPRTSPPSASPPSGAQRRGHVHLRRRAAGHAHQGRAAQARLREGEPRGRGARSRASANGVKRQSRAAAAGARCRSRADVAGWRGRWQCPATRHSLPAVRAAAARRPLAGCVCAAGCRPPHARLATHASCADDVLSSRVLECCAVCLSVWRHRFLDMWLHHLIPPFAASVCI